ncbi:dermonecrotic toxin domain-containing protein [Erwinia piriflorinigrans]|uniref:Dermonecrotic toxin DNT n=1 Tax=Erwinia piriflorinigrans CFBP 5888 TaxID=1161919 RepID=V5Z4X4_9GAMM|nr:DUF6543 domain-containing protein [Erwinia piriflorinigrans]CCG86049.1 Dermonecrotic toxin DNT [Erwinia piriflorinigrans CFBP 5888]
MEIPSFYPRNDMFFSQSEHDVFVSDLAKEPGLHRYNVNRKNLSSALIYYISGITSFEKNSSSHINANENNSLSSVLYPFPHNDACALQHAFSQSKIRKANGQNGQGVKQRVNIFFSSDLTQLTRDFLQGCSNLTRQQQTELSIQELRSASRYALPPLSVIAKKMGNGIGFLLSHITGIVSHAEDYIDRHDPFTLPMSEASILNKKSKMRKIADVEDSSISIKDKIFRKKNSHDDIQKNQQANKSFINNRMQALHDYFEVFNTELPGIEKIAATLLREALQKKFHLGIDPEKNYLMCFRTRIDSGNDVVFAEPLKTTTLTACLLTKFDTDFLEHRDEANRFCRIYEIKYIHNKSGEFDSKDAVNISPLDFVSLVCDMDIYKYAKKKMVECFSQEDRYIKKTFIQFIYDLEASDILPESAEDVLNGVGLLEGKEVRTAFFSINGYSAANAFFFENNKNDRVTLYLPNSYFKFLSFRSYFEMAAWVTNACATKENRVMIASHFSIVDRQNGFFYDGIDAWLNRINEKNFYYTRICTNLVPILSKDFFKIYFHSQKSKILSDLESRSTSGKEMIRDMWKEALDTQNIKPDRAPLSHLIKSLEYAVNADSDHKQLQEWNHIIYDEVNIIAIVIMNTAINLSSEEGYDFIDGVTRGVKLEKEIAIKPNSPALNGIYQEILKPIECSAEINDRIRAIDRFLPVKTPVVIDLYRINEVIHSVISTEILNHPYRLHYGFLPNIRDHAYLQVGCKKYKTAYISAEKILDAASRAAHNHDLEGNIKRLFCKIINTNNERVLDEAIKRLSHQMSRVKIFLNSSKAISYRNIIFVSAKRRLYSQDTDFFHTTIAGGEHLKRFMMGFTLKEDPVKRIFIMLESNPDSPAHRGNLTSNLNITILEPAIVREEYHLTSCITEVCHAARFEDYYLPGDTRAVKREFNIALDNGIVTNNKFFQDFTAEIFNYLGTPKILSEESSLAVIKKTPMLMANLMMNNADTFIVLVKYLASMQVNQGMQGDINKYDDHDSNHDMLGLLFFASM